MKSATLSPCSIEGVGFFIALCYKDIQYIYRWMPRYLKELRERYFDKRIAQNF
ncbi:hypothetical protein [uncultured Helicobacter sp.]|uniref:hypothetical protein n=1 Tax=uncultured Helicobacter sp. TaxID=175537 RepID=UPI0026081424|nr:hypothetical protein [uncultured Helicobacter sp.]